MDLTRYSPARSRGALRPLAHLIAAIDFAAVWIIVVLLAAMVAIVSGQVLLRYALNSSIGWSDEVSRLTFVWTIFLAIPLGIKAGVHIGIEFLPARLPPKGRDALGRVVALIAAAMMVLVSWQAIVLAADQWDELMSSLNFSSSWFIVPLAISGAHSALHLLWIVLDGVRATDESLLQDLA